MSKASPESQLPDECRRFRADMRDSLGRVRLALCHAETLIVALALLKPTPSPRSTNGAVRVSMPSSESIGK